MAQSIAFYDPDKVHVIIHGVDISPSGATEFCSIEPRGPLWNTIVGSDGEVIRVRAASFPALVRIRLLPNAPHLRVLSVPALADLSIGAGAGPILISDFGGPWSYAASTSYLESWPSQAYTASGAGTEWVYSCPSLSVVPH